MQTDRSDLNSLRELFKKEEKKILDDYATFLEFESIGADPAFTPQVQSCCGWLAAYLKEIGFDVEVWETKGHPVIFASHLQAGPDQPTLLIYHHYDVQPVDPLDEWTTPPFKPAIREGNMYARGAQDNKGQCFYTVQALKALLKQYQTFPINIKLCIEGEEESGSGGLQSILKDKQNELRADFLAIVDVNLKNKNTPAVTLGVRGIVTMEVELQGSALDLHSGMHGGLVYNPIHALVELLSKLRAPNGKINIPGFYEKVKPLNDTAKGQIDFDFDVEEYEKNFETKANGGETDFTPLERNWTRPTLEINGISGGYRGAGFKTVIPAKAHAKISCRLVPDQDPQEIGALVSRFLKENAPEGMKVNVNVYPGGGTALHADPGSSVVKAFAKAYEEIFDAPCQYIFQGASIPIVTELARTSQSEAVLVGMGLDSDQIHAPNEHFGLDRLEKGFLLIARAIQLLKNTNKGEIR